MLEYGHIRHHGVPMVPPKQRMFYWLMCVECWHVEQFSSTSE
jgi:hypothetical protein